MVMQLSRTGQTLEQALEKGWDDQKEDGAQHHQKRFPS